MISLIEINKENILQYREQILAIERVSFPTPWSGDAFDKEVRRNISHLWALVNDGALLGYVCFWIFADEIHLMNIAVHPERRGKGLGRHMLAKVLDRGSAQGVSVTWLEVRPSNLAARLLYGSAGFREIGRRPRYYTDTNEDAIVMSLTLAREAHPLPRAGRKAVVQQAP